MVSSHGNGRARDGSQAGRPRSPCVLHCFRDRLWPVLLQPSLWDVAASLGMAPSRAYKSPHWPELWEMASAF